MTKARPGTVEGMASVGGDGHEAITLVPRRLTSSLESSCGTGLSSSRQDRLAQR